MNCLLFGEQKECTSFREFLVLKEMFSKEDQNRFLYYTRPFILDGYSDFTLHLRDMSQNQEIIEFDPKRSNLKTAIILFINADETITLLKGLSYTYKV